MTVLILILTALNAVVVIEEIHGNILRVVEKCRMLDGQCVPDPCLPLPRECVVSINNNSMSDEIWRCMARQSCCFWNAMHMLAMEVAKFLNFAGSIFLTDNGTLADTTKKDFDKS
uniref:Bifunctional inhibitor/plant lipid transfer protein/seed storage helical domain-containing protein n=1 Tax=Oryza glumipatula TaxID=40148 RepID=A0A0D9YTV3_9ORYZ